MINDTAYRSQGRHSTISFARLLTHHLPGSSYQLHADDAISDGRCQASMRPLSLGAGHGAMKLRRCAKRTTAHCCTDLSQNGYGNICRCLGKGMWAIWIGPCAYLVIHYCEGQGLGITLWLEIECGDREHTHCAQVSTQRAILESLMQCVTRGDNVLFRECEPPNETMDRSMSRKAMLNQHMLPHRPSQSPHHHATQGRTSIAERGAPKRFV